MALFIGAIAFILIIILIFLISKEYKKNEKKFNALFAGSCVIGILMSIMLLYSSYTIKIKLDKYNSEIVKAELANEQTNGIDYDGTLGDLFGGVYAPVIGLIGAFFGGLAFYAQYKANQEIREQFKLQQFESQFYEMLALHKDNISEMKIEGYEFDNSGNKNRKDTTGRKIFYTMNTELINIHQIIKKMYLLSFNKLNTINEIEEKYLFSIAYHVFFHGLEKTENLYKQRGLLVKDDFIYFNNKLNYFFSRVIFQIRTVRAYSLNFESANLTKYTFSKQESILINNSLQLKVNFNYNFFLETFSELRKIRIRHQHDTISVSRTDKKNYKNYFKIPLDFSHQFNGQKHLKLYFNYKPFDGHQTRLGHYYRHLFSMVNHVVKQEILSYDDKRDYLKILRAQFSIYELSLMFYNYYAGFGKNWENKYIDGNMNLGNSFFLDYRFLHNIEVDYRFIEIDPIKVLSKLISNNVKCKKGYNLDSDPIFELY